MGNERKMKQLESKVPQLSLFRPFPVTKKRNISIRYKAGMRDKAVTVFSVSQIGQYLQREKWQELLRLILMEECERSCIRRG